MSENPAITFANNITTILDTNHDVMANPIDNIVDTKRFKERETLISRLSDISAVLPSITLLLDKSLKRTRQIHDEELSRISELINRLRQDGGDSSWTTIVRKKPRTRNISKINTTYIDSNINTTGCNQPVESLRKNKSTSGMVSEIQITDCISLDAIRVSEFDHVEQNGNLYYVESANHFAIKLGGRVFHGNVGIIYTDEKNPEKIKDCKFFTSCTRRSNCDYYHNPTKFSGSKDCRNFVASAWLYSPPTSHYKNRTRSRRFGSRDTMDADIFNLQPEEIDRFYDQMMHDLLCAMILSKMHKDTRESVRAT